ncbi:MAG: HAMP domain-containing protein [Ilumatobacter sp.]|nr:HAMP domain-containing protein [Ilumatobacter sp.]
MRRLSLSTKLIAATLPLLLAVAALLALTVRSDLDAIAQAESGADLGAVWEPLITSMTAVDDEADIVAGDRAGAIDTDPVGDTTEGDVTAASDTDIDTSIRRATDQAVNDLRNSIEELDAFEAANAHVTAARSALSAARRSIDMAVIAPQMVAEIDPIESYRLASRELVAVGELLPSEAGDVELGRELLAVVKLAEARVHANDVASATALWPNTVRNTTPLVQARDSFANLVTALGEFEAVAPDEWATAFRQSGFTTAVNSFGRSLDSVARAAEDGRVETFDTTGFAELLDQGVEFQRAISDSIVENATSDAETTRSAALARIAIILGAVLLGALIAWMITRSITRRVKAVAQGANRVASEQLPALVEAMRDPRGKAVLPDIEPVDARGHDDLAELAQAFNAMQETLVDVAHEQVEVLRRGVSDIFITMARRNRSLIDRQLSMLDEYEASVDDPEVLANYYQLDHLATRMRRNSESLLVLANAEPKRRRVKATEIDDVVRASIGEVEDYRRIEIQHLESLQVRGNVVADISHLLAELLDNATSFSPPDSAVRVGGRHAGDSYMIRIVDDGVGIPTERLRELNEILRDPPIVGLSVESTLGISVVSLLANKHGIEVTLSAGNPGLTVDVVLPGSLFGPIDAPAALPNAAPLEARQPADPTEAAWDQTPGLQTEPAAPAPDAPLTVPEPTFDPGPMPAPVADAPPPMVAEPIVADEAPVAEPPAAHSAPAPLAVDTSGFDALLAGTPPAPTALPDSTTDATPAPVAEPAPPQPATSDSAPAEPTPADVAPSTEPALDQAPAEAPTLEAPGLPSPTPREHGEFDIPPTPPVTGSGLTQRPVTPEGARPLPTPPPATESTPSLPTRTHRGSGPEGPDRLAAISTVRPEPVTDGPGEASALQAALAAFDTGRNAARSEATPAPTFNAPDAPAAALPTRAPVADAGPDLHDESPVSQSRVDPSALRDRLRAFQSGAAEGAPSAGTPDAPARSEDQPNHDLEGDPR